MCGLVLAAIKSQNGFFNGDLKSFEEMLYMDALRGPDSTGLACFYNDGEMQLVKDTSEAAFFRYATNYDDVIKRLIKNGKAVVGHNRKKTMGLIDDASAHPFAIADANGDVRYLFVHNGTLTNTTTLEKSLKPEVVLESQVDSEVLGNMLCPLDGNKEAIEEALGTVFGAYACIWIDQKAEKLYMVRNSDRPLFLAETSVGYFAASEPGFIYAALSRNRLKVDKCEQIDANALYSIDLSDNLLKLTKEELTIKKAMPVAITGTTKRHGRGATKAHTFSNKTDGKISKNEFKRFYKKYIGSIGSFFIDDYVERTIGDWKSGWWVWGTDDAKYELPHQARGVLRAMPEADLVVEHAGTTIWGRITNITRDEETGMPVMMLSNLSVSRNGVILKERMEHDNKTLIQAQQVH